MMSGSTVFIINHPLDLMLSSIVAAAVDGRCVAIIARHPYFSRVRSEEIATLKECFVETLELDFTELLLPLNHLWNPAELCHFLHEGRKLKAALKDAFVEPVEDLYVFDAAYPLPVLACKTARAKRIHCLKVSSAVDVITQNHGIFNNLPRFVQYNFSSLITGGYWLNMDIGKNGEVLQFAWAGMPFSPQAYPSSASFLAGVKAMGFSEHPKMIAGSEILLVGSPDWHKWYPQVDSATQDERTREIVSELARETKVVYMCHPQEGLESVRDNLKGLDSIEILQSSFCESYILKNQAHIAGVYGIASSVLVFAQSLGIPAFSFIGRIGFTAEQENLMKRYIEGVKLI